MFAIVSAAATLRSAFGLEPTGSGAVCFASGQGGAPPDLLALLDRDPAMDVSVRTDEYGSTWIACRQSEVDLPELVIRLRGVNTALAAAGLGPVRYVGVGFSSPGTPGAEHRLAVIYLAEHGTFYPFAPIRVPVRDSVFELRVRAALDAELPIEPDLSNWLPLWNAPLP